MRELYLTEGEMQGAPVCIGTDVVNEWAVLQDSLYFSQGDIFTSL